MVIINCGPLTSMDPAGCVEGQKLNDFGCVHDLICKAKGKNEEKETVARRVQASMLKFTANSHGCCGPVVVTPIHHLEIAGSNPASRTFSMRIHVSGFFSKSENSNPL